MWGNPAGVELLTGSSRLLADIKTYPGTLKYSPDTWHAFYQVRSFGVFLEDSRNLSLPMSQMLGGGVTQWKARITWYGQCMHWRLQDLGSGFLIVLDSWLLGRSVLNLPAPPILELLHFRQFLLCSGQECHWQAPFLWRLVFRLLGPHKLLGHHSNAFCLQPRLSVLFWVHDDKKIGECRKLQRCVCWCRVLMGMQMP